MTNQNIDDMVAQAKQGVEMASGQLLKTFEFVPEDKIAWSPSPTAQTPLHIVAHCGIANGFFASLLRGEPLPLPPTAEEARAVATERASTIKTREAAVKLIETSTRAILNALDDVSVDMLDTMPASPFGTLPFAIWMQVPAIHMSGHAEQINYLQTIWGDLENHR